MTNHANAGPLPERPVTASRCFSSRILALPNVENTQILNDLSSLLQSVGQLSTVIPSLICIIV